MTVSTRQGLIDYAKRELGYPVINIEIAPEQEQDRVDEAIQFYQDFHSDGNFHTFLKKQLTGTKIDVASTVGMVVGSKLTGATSGAYFYVVRINSSTQVETKRVVGTLIPGEAIGSTTVTGVTIGDIQNGYVSVANDQVIGITKVVPAGLATVGTGSSSTDAWFFDPQYHMIVNQLSNIASMDLVYYQETMSYLSLMQQVLRPIESLRFNKHGGKVYLDVSWDAFDLDSYLIFEAYVAVDPATCTAMYNDRMLKKLTAAYLKRQWAQNVSKFKDVQLMGGVSIDAQSLMANALAECEAAEREIRDVYEMPAIGFLG